MISRHQSWDLRAWFVVTLSFCAAAMVAANAHAQPRRRPHPIVTTLAPSDAEEREAAMREATCATYRASAQRTIATIERLRRGERARCHGASPSEGASGAGEPAPTCPAAVADDLGTLVARGHEFFAQLAEDSSCDLGTAGEVVNNVNQLCLRAEHVIQHSCEGGTSVPATRDLRLELALSLFSPSLDSAYSWSLGGALFLDSVPMTELFSQNLDLGLFLAGDWNSVDCPSGGLCGALRLSFGASARLRFGADLSWFGIRALLGYTSVLPLAVDPWPNGDVEQVVIGHGVVARAGPEFFFGTVGVRALAECLVSSGVSAHYGLFWRTSLGIEVFFGGRVSSD